MGPGVSEPGIPDLGPADILVCMILCCGAFLRIVGRFALSLGAALYVPVMGLKL